jgi:hypothetical protein
MDEPVLTKDLRDEIHVEDKGIRKGPFTLAEFKKRRRAGEFWKGARFYEWKTGKWRWIWDIPGAAGRPTFKVQSGDATITFTVGDDRPDPDELLELAEAMRELEASQQKPELPRPPFPTAWVVGAFVGIAAIVALMAFRLEGPDLEIALFLVLFPALVAAVTFTAVWFRKR